MWVDDKGNERLYAAGLHGVITEYDLTGLVPKAVSDAYGGAIWCMCKNASNTLLATACEDGKIRTYDLDLNLKNFFTVSLPNKDTTNNRLLSIIFNDNASKLFAAGTTGVFCIDVKTGQTLFHVDVADAIVWSLCMLAYVCFQVLPITL